MATFSYPTYNAANYRSHRPSYMKPVYNTIMEYHQSGKNCAMDVATGTGQAAVELAKLFTNVRATDISETMLSQAIPRDNIKYVQEPAERMDLPDKSVDLVVTAEAAHWFDIVAFQTEVQRVLTDHGTLAIWGYNVPMSLKYPDITKALNNYNDVRLGPYWEKGRALLDDLYGSMKILDNWSDEKRYLWDNERLIEYWRTHDIEKALQNDDSESKDTAATAPFMPLRRMTIEQLADYLRTWSPYTTWKRSPNAETETDPVDEVIDVVKRALNDAAIANVF
ncbi:S-adenosyl-L-methionine-dependent methyltransferase [Syncephalis plumigaleata]|nr:S-adenosyl-L-methionine-dependent methyltransferase [Syncephalis plumigaleata]